MAFYIVEDECLSCGECVPECSTDSISETMVAFKIDADTCTECKGEADSPMCVSVCPIDGCILPAD